MNAEPNPLEANQQAQESTIPSPGECVVQGLVHTVHRRGSARVTFESCDVTDPKSGQDIKNVPCAGLNVAQGDLLEITVRAVRRKAARHKDAGGSAG